MRMEPCLVTFVTARSNANRFQTRRRSNVLGIGEKFAWPSSDFTMHCGKGDVVIVGLAANTSHPDLGEVCLEVESFAAIALCAAWIGQDGLFQEVPL